MSEKVIKEILVKQTCVEISPYYMGECKDLEALLRIYDPINFKFSKILYHYDEGTRTLTIPRGINVKSLEKRFGTVAKYFKAKKGKTIDIKLTTPPRDVSQLKAIEFLTGNGSSRETILYSRLLLTLGTGAGKTYCNIAAICKMKKRAIVILHSDSLLKQWREKFLKFTDIDDDDIYMISGRPSVDKILKQENKFKYKIILASHRTLANYGKNYGWDQVREAFNIMNIGIKVFDEAHKEFQNIIDIDLSTNVYKNFYLTATADRSAFKEKVIFNNIYGDVPNFFTKSEKEDNYINTLILSYDSNPSMVSQMRCKSKKGFNGISYMNELEEDPRNFGLFTTCLNTIFDSVIPKLKEGEKMAIFLLTKSLVFKIYNYILYQRKDIDIDDVGIFTSDVTNPKVKKLQKEKKIILSTSRSLGTGDDIPGLRCLVMTEPYSSSITGNQVMGRLRNIGGELIYIEIVNVGYEGIKNQFKIRKKYILKKSKKVTIINIKGE